MLLTLCCEESVFKPSLKRYPLVALAIALGTEQIAASATSSYCFLGDYLGSETDYNGYLYGLYVGPCKYSRNWLLRDTYTVPPPPQKIS